MAANCRWPASMYCLSAISYSTLIKRYQGYRLEFLWESIICYVTIKFSGVEVNLTASVGVSYIVVVVLNSGGAGFIVYLSAEKLYTYTNHLNIKKNIISMHKICEVTI